MADFRIGIGYDVHQLVEGRDLILAGLKIPHTKGLLGHSDADVALHAITDAILGALALGDIGSWFPDNDNSFKDIDSAILLKKVYDHVVSMGWSISNLDCSIIAQAPKLRPHIDGMRLKVSEILTISLDRVSIKATTTEKLGFVGRGEGIATEAVVMLKR